MNHITDPVPASLEHWSSLRDRILESAQQVMGSFPMSDRSSPPTWSVVEETECESHVRQSITYEADEDCETTAFICRPHSSTSASMRGILCLHPTSHEHGYRDVVG
ncbi:MAG TPA: alpha/beta hydrolase, partial [Candidatus Latescibacteria bacterium]|nr:alpha/beta hydrolase [Candidatus Latescibacterota bacterium]